MAYVFDDFESYDAFPSPRPEDYKKDLVCPHCGTNEFIKIKQEESEDGSKGMWYIFCRGDDCENETNPYRDLETCADEWMDKYQEGLTAEDYLHKKGIKQ